MNKYTDLNINEDTLFDYFLPQKDLLKKLILNDINSSIKINNMDDDIYVNFKHKEAIIFYLDDNNIEDIIILDYDYIISKDILKKIIENKEKLDSRLLRFANYDTIDLLKNEIINALSLKRIRIDYDDIHDIFIGKWRYLTLGFIIDKTFKFIDISL